MLWAEGRGDEFANQTPVATTAADAYARHVN
jgi:hypothetical protein